MTRKRTLQAELRFQVWRRDHGKCASCGGDCEALRKRLRALGPEERRLERLRLGIPEGLTTFWQAHHIVAFSEGGLDLVENMATLCWKCHPKATAQLMDARTGAHERAAGRPLATALEREYGG